MVLAASGSRPPAKSENETKDFLKPFELALDTLLDITQTIIEKETSLDIQENEESEVTSITMDRIDDITDKEGSDEDGNTLDIDDPIPESNSPKPLLTEITAYTEYQNHTIKELKDILTEMQLPTSGNKTKLIQRIVSNKNKISN